MQKKIIPLLASIWSASVLAAAADQVTAQDAYVRLAPPGAPATAAFMVLKNTGDKDVRVTKVESTAAKVAELHNHTNDGGVMKMRPVTAIDIKAGAETVLQPGGLHLMLIDLKSPLREGEQVPIVLNFADGSSKRIEVKVSRPAAPSIPMEHKH